MAHETYALHGTDSASSTAGWTGKIRSWLRKKREKKERKNIVIQLLSYDDRYLKDLGLSRYELVREFGYDPYALPEFYRWRAGVMPHF